MQVCCIVPLRSDVGLVELKGAAYLMSSPMVALVVRELVMLMYNRRLNERGAVSWDLDYLHSSEPRVRDRQTLRPSPPRLVSARGDSFVSTLGEGAGRAARVPARDSD